MKKIAMLFPFMLLSGILLIQSCSKSEPAPVEKKWSDYRKSYENLNFKDPDNPYEVVGIEHNAMFDYYKDYVKLHPVKNPPCGDYWEDPDCQKINSAIRSALKMRAAYENKDSSDYMRLFDQSTQSFQNLKGEESVAFVELIRNTSQYETIKKEVSQLTPSNLDTFEQNMGNLLIQVREDSSLSAYQKELLGIGITVGRYSAYYHISHGVDSSRLYELPDWVVDDIMGAWEGCLACEIFCPECAVVVAAVASIASYLNTR